MKEIKKDFKWISIILLLLAISIIVIIVHGNSDEKPKTARIIQNGTTIRIIDLQNVKEPYEFEVISDDGAQNTIRVENGRIGIIEASCTDKICVGQGYIDNMSVPIVCMPNRLSIVIEDGGNSTDAVTGGI